MATSVKSRKFVIFLIILTLLARLVHEFSTMSKMNNSKLGLRELINNVPNSEWNQKRPMLGGRLQRVSPAGPDPQHH